MMCGCRLSPLPHSGDVLGIVSTCLTCQLLHCLRALGLLCSPWNRLRSSGKNQNIKPSCRPPCPHAENCVGSGGKIIPHTKTHRGFSAVVPPVDRNLRSRQECARAWSWLSSKQISMRRQVCSACPHSCATVFITFRSNFSRRAVCKAGMLAQQRVV